MSEDNLIKIIIAFIGLLGTALGAMLGYVSRSKKQAVIDAKREQEQSDNFTRLFVEMDGIKKRLDVHNKYAEKFSDIEKSMVSIKKDIEYTRVCVDSFAVALLLEATREKNSKKICFFPYNKRIFKKFCRNKRIEGRIAFCKRKLLQFFLGGIF